MRVSFYVWGHGGPAEPEEGTVEGKIADYKKKLAGLTVDELMDQLTRAALANKYGSHSEQINVIRSEIKSRVASR